MSSITDTLYTNICTGLETVTEQLTALHADHVQPRAQEISTLIQDLFNNISEWIAPHALTLRDKLVEWQETASSQAQSAVETFREFAANTQTKITELSNTAIEQASELKVQIESYLETELHVIASTAFDIAKKVAGVAVATILFLSNSSVFVIGFIAGIAAPDTMSNILDRVTNVWKRLSPLHRGVVIAAGSIAWPISLVTLSFGVGAAVALEMKRVAEAPVPQQQINNAEEEIVIV